MMKQRRRQGGWTLLMVLFILLALSFMVGAYYTQTEDHLFTGQAVGAHAIATARAEEGAQQAVALMRSGTINVNAITATCNDTASNPLTSCNTAGIGIMLNPTTGAPLDNGHALSARQGGGLQYNYVIYKPQLTGATTNLYRVRSIGYYGYSLTSPNLFSSELEVTVEVGTTTTPPCSNPGDYGCT
jgi:hypothetical protein